MSEASEGFPDLTISVEGVMAEGDRVTARVTMRGTHSGEFQGIAPTNKRVEVKAIDRFRIEDGKILEHWDTLTIHPASYGSRSAPELQRASLPGTWADSFRGLRTRNPTGTEVVYYSLVEEGEGAGAFLLVPFSPTPSLLFLRATAPNRSVNR